MKKANHIMLMILLFGFMHASHSKEYAVFDVVGDSISEGANPELQELHGWVDMLFGESQGGNPAKTNTLSSLWSVISFNNSARSGSKASEWANDLGGWLSSVKARHPDLLVVFIGGNDLTAYFAEDDIFSISEQEDYRTNLTSIITNLLDNIPVPDIVLLNYYDLFDGHSENLQEIWGLITNFSIATSRANQVIKEVASLNQCYLVDGVYSDFLHHCYGGELGDNHLQPDYVDTPLANFDSHPITAGHSKIHELVYEKLEYLKAYAVPEYWMDQYGLTNHYEDVATDSDVDGSLAWEEYVAGTDPTNAASVFKVSVSFSESFNLLYWDPIPNRTYGAYWSTNLQVGFHALATNLISNAYMDTEHNNSEESLFYQLRVQSD